MPTKVCSKCSREWAITEFRRLRKGSDKRTAECRQCYNAYMRKRHHEARTKSIHTFASSVSYNRRNKQRLVTIVGMMMEKCGGLQRFAEKWHATIKQAQAEGRTDLVFRNLKAILELTATANELRREAVDEMDEEARTRYIEQQMIAMVQENPEIAMWAAAQLDGWTVIPPK